MSVTPQDAVKKAARAIRAGGKRPKENVRDYLAYVASFRPDRECQGTASEELEICRLARAAKALHPGIPFGELLSEARDTVLWWRWPLSKQVAAWLGGKWPFDGER